MRTMSTMTDSAVASPVPYPASASGGATNERVEQVDVQRTQEEAVRAAAWHNDHIAKFKQKDFYGARPRPKPEALKATDEQPDQQPMELSNNGQLLRPNASREATTTQPAEVSATEALGETWRKFEKLLSATTTKEMDGVNIGEELAPEVRRGDEMSSHTAVETNLVPATCDEAVAEAASVGAESLVDF